MTRQLIRQKLAGVIAHLDQIIASESEEANGSPELKECRKDLLDLVKEFDRKGSQIDISKVLVAVYKAIDLICSWTHEDK
jgi:hypothetical protein